MCKSCDRRLADLPVGLLENLETASEVFTDLFPGVDRSAAFIAGYLTATTGQDQNLAVMEFYRGLQIGRAKICKV